MPGLKGSLSYTRLFVEGELPDDFRTKFMRSIRFPVEKAREAGSARASSQPGGPIAAVSEPFEKTCRLRRVVEAPYTVAARLGRSKAEETVWSVLECTLLGAPEHQSGGPDRFRGHSSPGE